MDSWLQFQFKKLRSFLELVLGEAQAAIGTAQNRADLPLTGLSTFTPGNVSPTIIAACLITPKFSGRFACEVTMTGEGTATGDTFTVVAQIATGASLVLGGGQSTSGQYRIGTTTPVTVTGTGVAVVDELATSVEVIGTTEFDTFSCQGTTHSPPGPYPLNIPIAFEIGMLETGGGHAIQGLSIAVSIYELASPTP